MNKHITLFAAGLIALGGLTGCNKKTAEKEQGPLELTCIEFSQADSLMNFRLTALLPTGDDEAATAMRDTLMTVVQRELATWYSNENSEITPLKDTDELEACAETCFNESLAQLKKDKEEYGLPFTAPYEWQFKVDTLGQTDRYITFSARGYQYMGGAHGGVFGRGAITFSKADGQPFAQWFADESDPALQQLMLEGIARYFTENEEQPVTADSLADYLLVNPAEVRLPAEAPFPTADGLVFTYQQYEIAPYAAGMPNFTLPYEQVKPYLTDGAKALLGL